MIAVFFFNIIFWRSIYIVICRFITCFLTTEQYYNYITQLYQIIHIFLPIILMYLMIYGELGSDCSTTGILNMLTFPMGIRNEAAVDES